MKRRHFLQFAGASLAAVGLSQTDLMRQADQYEKALAQDTPRKLALLVGINNYPAYRNLQGCLTDVDLQYELLVNRFGFKRDDIVRVSDSEALKPDRNTILNTFREHLIKQAKPGDVVVFHFSGHGANVYDPDPIYEGSNLNGTIVPNDFPDGPGRPNYGTVPDIMGRTLFLLLRSLKTENVTAILDSCHSGGGLRGGASVRALREEGGDARRAMPEEFALQQELLAKMDLSFEDFQAERRAGVSRGLGIGSAQFVETALDMAYSDFHAGAFTYLLTRYLWQLPGGATAEAVRNDLKRSTQSAAATFGDSSQIPTFQPAPDSNSLSKPIYFTGPVRGSAEAVITNVSGDRVEFWLGGVSSQALNMIGAQAGFTVLSDSREPIGEIVQTGRDGLKGTGKLVDGQGVTEGMLLRETVVGLPSNPQLLVGVDLSLGDEVDAALRSLSEVLVSAQSGQPQIAAARIDQQQAFDYVLGRMTTENTEQLRADGFDDLPSVGAIALFTRSLVPIPGSSGLAGESVTTAVNRLQGKLKSLLVTKVLKALSVSSSGLSVTGKIFAESNANRSVPLDGKSESAVGSAPFQSGEKLKIRVANNDRRQSVYLSCLAINSEGNVAVIYPTNWEAPEDSALIQPRSELVIPQLDSKAEYRINVDEKEELGYVEVMTLVSTASLRNALKALKEIAVNRSFERGSLPLNEGESLTILGSLLGDMNDISRGTRGNASPALQGIDADRSAVDSGAIAVFSTVLEAIKS